MPLEMGSSMMDNSVITWLHPSAFEEAIQMNSECGFGCHDMDWLKSQFKEQKTFAMGCFDHRGELLGWALHRKEWNAYRIIWICVREERRFQTVAKSIIHRFKVWLANDRDQRKAIVADVPEDNLAAQVFFRSVGFVCKHPMGSNVYKFSYLKNQKELQIIKQID